MWLTKLFSKVMLLGVLTLSTLAGCEVKDVRLDEVESFEVKSMSKGRLEADLTLKLTNPNFYPVTVKSAEFDMFLGKSKLGTAHLVKPLKIKSNSSESYTTSIEGDLSGLLSAGLSGISSFLSGKSPEVLIKGDLKVGNMFVTKRVYIEERTEFPLNL